MIYNFAQLLKDQFPNETIYTNGRILLATQTEIPVRNILVNDSGGNIGAWLQFKRATVQIIIRDTDAVLCNELAQTVFAFLHGRFGLLLPDVTVNGITYPSLKVSQISAIQLPYNLGSNDEGGIEYSTNYEIIV